MLQKTNAAKVVPIYQTFLSKYPNFNTLAEASIEEATTRLKPLGLSFRAERLYQAARILVADYDSHIPDSENQLLLLPGVGKYTARSICSQAFSQPLAILDTNVARILKRFWGIRGGRVESRCRRLWQAAERVVPETEVGLWNLMLLDFGALVCTAKKPRCAQCPLKQQCHYYDYQLWALSESNDANSNDVGISLSVRNFFKGGQFRLQEPSHLQPEQTEDT